MLPSSPSDADEPGAAAPSAAQRTLAILSFVAGRDSAASVGTLAENLGLPKATVSRLCAQLAATGWLERALEQRGFGVGPRLRELAGDALRHGIQPSLRHQVLKELVAHLGETCNLTALLDSSVIYLDRVETSWPLRPTLDIGSQVPLHATASGKLFLAYMPPPRRKAIIQGLTLVACTVHTLTDAEALDAECEAIRREAYACDREEFMAGLIAVAVPIFDHAGNCRAAVAVHAPTARMDMAAALGKLPNIRAAAQKIATLL